MHTFLEQVHDAKLWQAAGGIVVLAIGCLLLIRQILWQSYQLEGAVTASLEHEAAAASAAASSSSCGGGSCGGGGGGGGSGGGGTTQSALDGDDGWPGWRWPSGPTAAPPAAHALGTGPARREAAAAPGAAPMTTREQATAGKACGRLTHASSTHAAAMTATPPPVPTPTSAPASAMEMV